MKLAIKFSSILIAGILALLAIDGCLAVLRETKFFRADMQHDAQLLGYAMKDLVADVWAANGEQRAMQLIEDANRREQVVQTRWVWLDGNEGNRHKPRLDRRQLRPVLQGKEASFPVSSRAGLDELVTYVPVRINGERLGALELSESMSQLNSYTRTTIAKTVAAMTGLLVASAGAVVLLGTLFVGRPLRRLVERVRRIGEGDLDSRLELRSGDELGELAAALNAMCRQLTEAREHIRTETEARIATLQQLRHADRLTTVGRLASGIAHEVGTPLNVISARAKQIAEGSLSRAGAVENAAIIGRQAERIAATIRRLLDFARPGRSQRKPLNLHEALRRSVNLLSTLAEKHRVSLQLAVGEDDLTVIANAGQIEQVFTNLIVNAIQAMPQGGRAEIRLGRRRARPPGDHAATEKTYACISVADEGVGISEENVGKVFEPFFTTKDIGEGTGLGLSLAYGIVTDHGGWIEVAAELGKGSCFSVWLPLVDGDPPNGKPGGGGGVWHPHVPPTAPQSDGTFPPHEVLLKPANVQPLHKGEEHDRENDPDDPSPHPPRGG